MCAAELSSLCGVRTIIFTLLTVSSSACVYLFDHCAGRTHAVYQSIKFPKPTYIHLDESSLTCLLFLFFRFLIAATAGVHIVADVVVNCRKIMTTNFVFHWKVSIIDKRKSPCVNFSTPWAAASGEGKEVKRIPELL